MTYDPHLGAAVQIDVAVTTACPEDQARLRARATKDGRGAADMAADKRRRYSSAGASLIPMIFEDGGRPAEETVALIRRLGAARRVSGRVGAEDWQVTAQLWQQASTLLQLGNAELVLSANGK